MLSDILQKIRAPRDHEPTVISLGQTWVDLMMTVPAVPAAGEFVNATAVSGTVGGAFQVLQAAGRMGARTQLGSVLGRGPWADYIRKELRANRIAHIGLTMQAGDNGFRVIQGDGERKAFTAWHGAEAAAGPDAFDEIRPQADDVVHIGSNALMNESSMAVAAFLERPECQADVRGFRIVINPTSTLRLVNDRLLETLVVARPLWSMNRQEARTLADRLGVEVDSSHEQRMDGGFDESMFALCEALSDALRSPIVLRAGSRGAWVKYRGSAVQHIEGFPAKATHQRSAGLAHTGALCALVAEGWSLDCAVQIANAAASLAITHNRHGVPFCPTYDEAYTLVEETLKVQ
ncbi:PfkB family carbohydrate kinase [Bifidobacterium cuniculi]|uniref:Ribokinase family sugar kinase n=1 Tax=Bifidobacterium cuniculi TaxID=1688 RepID=A0A087AJL4_9BIFI|nr:PfkB family carbohydrate kinase [Bifidobacterium cuniculi]KFI58964.1 Ribokinase family sugar kinase [Bifidobacterium cuniculi]